MLIVGAMWGFHGPLLKFAFAAGLTFPQLAVAEYLVGAVGFGAVVLWQRTPWPQADRVWWLMMLAGGVVGSGVALFLFWSYQLGPVPVGATLLFLYVPFTQILNALLARKWPPGLQIVSVLLVTSGAVLATDFLGVAGNDSLRGAPQAVLAAMCFAGFFVLSSRLGERSTPVFRSFFFSVVSGTIVLLIALVAGWNLHPVGISPVTVTGWVILLGVVGQVVPVFLLVKAAPKTGGGLGSILTSIELPVAVGLSAWLLGDAIRVAQTCGIGLILVGIALPHWNALRRV